MQREKQYCVPARAVLPTAWYALQQKNYTLLDPWQGTHKAVITTVSHVTTYMVTSRRKKLHA